MKKNLIKFSEDGTEFAIEFADGSENLNFSSKIAGLKAIPELFEKKKITAEEYTEMISQIIDAEKVSWGEELEILIGRISSLFGSFLLDLSPFSFSLADLLARPDKPVKEAHLKMCDCGGNHCRIYCKDCYTGRIDNKKEAEEVLKKLKKDKKIDDKEFEKVKAEIESSTLP